MKKDVRIYNFSNLAREDQLVVAGMLCTFNRQLEGLYSQEETMDAEEYRIYASTVQVILDAVYDGIVDYIISCIESYDDHPLHIYHDAEEPFYGIEEDEQYGWLFKRKEEEL